MLYRSVWVRHQDLEAYDMSYIILIRLNENNELVSIDKLYQPIRSLLEFDTQIEASLFADEDPSCNAHEYEIIEVKNI